MSPASTAWWLAIPSCLTTNPTTVPADTLDSLDNTDGAVGALDSRLALTIDSGQSSLSVSGTVGGVSLTEQSTGSLTTSLSGTINAELHDGSIQFTGGSSLALATQGGTYVAGRHFRRYRGGG